MSATKIAVSLSLAMVIDDVHWRYPVVTTPPHGLSSLSIMRLNQTVIACCSVRRQVLRANVSIDDNNSLLNQVTRVRAFSPVYSGHTAARIFQNCRQSFDQIPCIETGRRGDQSSPLRLHCALDVTRYGFLPPAYTASHLDTTAQAIIESTLR